MKRTNVPATTWTICQKKVTPIGRAGEFDRWITAHDKALHEQIARAIEAKADDPDPTLEPQYFVAMDIAASIARGEEQTMNDTTPQPMLPDLAEPTDAEIQAAAESFAS